MPAASRAPGPACLQGQAQWGPSATGGGQCRCICPVAFGCWLLTLHVHRRPPSFCWSGLLWHGSAWCKVSFETGNTIGLVRSQANSHNWIATPLCYVHSPAVLPTCRQRQLQEQQHAQHMVGGRALAGVAQRRVADACQTLGPLVVRPCSRRACHTLSVTPLNWMGAWCCLPYAQVRMWHGY